MENPTSKRDGKVNGKFKIIGNWHDQSKKLKEKFPNLTDADLKFETDKEEELLTRLEKSLNKSRGEVIDFIIKGNSAYL